VMPALRAAKLVADSHGTLELQRALAELIGDGTFARHVRRVVRVYAERRATLLAALAEHADLLDVVPSSAGLHVGWFLRRAGEPRDSQLVASPIAPYYMRRPRAGLALGFGLIATADIAEGVRRLAKAIRMSRRA
jgi:GntR family transcriptional regulator/MocR family aminotransferase